MAAKAIEIEILKCGACGALDTPPRELCRKCHSAKIAPFKVKGSGKLVTWTVIRRPPQAFRDEGAYPVAVVELDAGVQITGRLKRAEGEGEPPANARVAARAVHKGAAVFEVVA